MTVSFPRQQARTRRFTLGAPRSVSCASDGARVAFLRSPSGTDPATALWVYDVQPGRERLVADPGVLLEAPGELTAQERARRERARESASGITSYAADPLLLRAAFALSGRVFAADLSTGEVRELATEPGGFDPRPSPAGEAVAYVAGGRLRLWDGARDRELLGGDDATYGLAEFVAAEEMDRTRGHWWSPDGERLLVARVDERAVQRWHVADPAEPGRPPVELAYPAAGTANAEVSLVLVDLDGNRRDVTGWDRAAFPYLAVVRWSIAGPPMLLVQSRDQRSAQVLAVDAGTGAARVLREDTDSHWLDVVPGVPAWDEQGRLVTTGDSQDTRRVLVAGEPVTPAQVQVRSVLRADPVLVTASPADDPTAVHLYEVGRGWLTSGAGVHTAVAGGGTLVVAAATLDRDGGTLTVQRPGAEDAVLPSYAEAPALTPRVTLRTVGERRLRAAVLLPTGHRAGERLPVLLDPYGGPHAQRVVARRSAYLESQWFAEQGFAVVVIDGRGTPGRGPAWERAVAGDLATAPLQDQLDGLAGVAEQQPDLDLTRVAIRGWSFGGYLAALAVLRRPDAVHAAVAGAPVTDWALYDTHYTERYLGTDPASASYARSSLLPDAHRLTRPLLLIHGLADDNVVAAHTLRLSRALLEAGRPHSVLPLSGVTHMTPQEEVAENLLLLQVAFLRSALGLAG